MIHKFKIFELEILLQPTPRAEINGFYYEAIVQVNIQNNIQG